MLALIGVLLFATYLLALAAAAWLTPERAERFLSGFAGSASAHYLELVLRLVAGGSLILAARQMLLPRAFLAFGWILVVTTAGLALVPWRWHQRFAQRVVPPMVGHLRLVAFFSFVLGGLLAAGVLLGPGFRTP